MKVRLCRSGILPYADTLAAMQAFTAQRDAQTADHIWQLQHAPVFTQGQAGKQENLLSPGDIPVIQADRGGQVTYHGPGQLVVYLLIDLKRRGLGVRELVTLIESSLIDLLADYGIPAAARSDAPGVYVEGAKIASLGLRIRRGCSFHGLALNVDMDLEPFSRIHPCGLQGMQMTQIAHFRPACTLSQVADDWLLHYLRRTGDSVDESPRSSAVPELLRTDNNE